MPRLPDLDSADREARLAEIRRQIAAGTYETPDKLEQAIDAFLDRMAPAEADSGRPRRRPK